MPNANWILYWILVDLKVVESLLLSNVLIHYEYSDDKIFPILMTVNAFKLGKFGGGIISLI